MLQLDKSTSKPYYVQIYEYYRREIEEHRMIAGMRLDSVRELAQAAGISKMTVEKAYYQLASEGYILRRHKARYEVASWAVWKRGPKRLLRPYCVKPVVALSMPMTLPVATWLWNAFPSTYGGNI